MIRGQGTYFDPEMWIQGQWQREQGHTDDVIGRHALRFVKEAPRDRPFALLYQFKAPHRDWNPAPRFRDRFEDVEIPLPPSFDESLDARSQAVQGTMMRIAEMPDFRKGGKAGDAGGEALAKANFQQFMRNYYRVLLGVDENVGRFLDHLAQSGLAEDTLVVYTTDNGFFLGEHGLFDKRLMYEPSIRIPLLLRWPAGIEAGRIDGEHFALNIDLAPTMLDLGGATIPGEMQGESWIPLIEQRPVDWRKDFLYEYYEYPAVHCVRPHRGVRNARWKLIEFWREPREYELYDLLNDPQEQRNLASDPAHAQMLAQLRARLAELRVQYDDHDPPGYLPEQQKPQQCHYGG
jgi:arylsulfatase A-like enzyme